MEELKVRRREEKGKIGCRRLRKEGFVPATLYHRGDESVDVAIEELELRRVIRGHGETGLVNLIFDVDKGSEQQAIYKNIQTDTFKKKILHVDLQGVRAGEKVNMTIPISLTGTPIGVTDMGGILVHQLNEVAIRCEPRFIIESLEIEVGHLKLHDTMTISDVTLPEGIEFHQIEDIATVATVVEPKKQVVAEETEEGEEGAEGAEGEEGAAAAPAEGEAPKA